jgi:hypothetical protein
MRLGRVWLLLAALAAWPAEARADILVAPFIGGTFAGQTTLPVFGLPTIDPSSALSSSLIIGVAGLWLGSGIVGVEGELAYAPGFFERADGQQALTSSSFTTASGSVVVTLPQSVTRESLRPYVVGGLGLLHVGVDDLLGQVPVNRNLLALDLGGGAIGMLNARTGIRFDIRHTRSVRDDEAPPNGFGGAQSRVRLSYWRATVGVTIRY